MEATRHKQKRRCGSRAHSQNFPMANNRLHIHIFSDLHPKRHLSFASEDELWPPHFFRYSEGAALHSDMRVPVEAMVVIKGVRLDKDQNWVFDDTGLGVPLLRNGLSSIIVGGQALDVCVKPALQDALGAGYSQSLCLPRAVSPSPWSVVSGFCKRCASCAIILED